MRSFGWQLSLLCLSARARGCEICLGSEASKEGVIDLSSHELDDLTLRHPLLLLLLYDPYSQRSLEARKQHDAAAQRLSELGTFTMVRADIRSRPSVAAQLHVSLSDTPALRVLRGDPSFGYPLPGGMRASEIVENMMAQQAIDLSSLYHDASSLTRLDASPRTRVVAHLSHPHSIHAFKQVAVAYAGVITFAMVITNSSVEGEPSSSRGKQPGDTEQVELFRERSEQMKGVLPACLVLWVLWASLPSVYELTSETARIYLRVRLLPGFIPAICQILRYVIDSPSRASHQTRDDPDSENIPSQHRGVSGVLFAETSQPKQRAYVRQHLRLVADRLADTGEHGIWLLHANLSDAAHSRLRAQLNLPEAHSRSTAPEAEFAIVVRQGPRCHPPTHTHVKPCLQVMSGSRIKATYVMRRPFTYDAVYDFCVQALRHELWQENWVYELFAHPMVVAAGTAFFIVLVYYIRIRHHSRCQVARRNAEPVCGKLKVT
ncbi:MAG: hypothetical protein SGPRY_001248 [Prymnesium sp.]